MMNTLKLFVTMVFALLVLVFVFPVPVQAMSALPDAGLVPLQTEGDGWAILGIALGAGLAVGMAGIGGGLGMGTASAAALGAITEKPEVFGKSILYVVFIEAIAIYGLVIAFLLLGKIDAILA
ncbi:MAG: ATP synthase subunit C [Candidatus Thorarchaeota archaeon]